MDLLPQPFMFGFVGDGCDLSGSSSKSDPFCSQTEVDGSHLPGSLGAELQEWEASSHPFPGTAVFPPRWCSNGHKTFITPGFDLTFGTLVWVVGRKGRGAPGSWPQVHRSGSPITFQVDAVCAALAA